MVATAEPKQTPGVGDDLAKDKKPGPGRPKNPSPPARASMFLELDPWVKESMDDLAAKNLRATVGEATISFLIHLRANGYKIPPHLAKHLPLAEDAE